jgi:hypothetical protein
VKVKLWANTIYDYEYTAKERTDKESLAKKMLGGNYPLPRHKIYINIYDLRPNAGGAL